MIVLTVQLKIKWPLSFSSCCQNCHSPPDALTSHCSPLVLLPLLSLHPKSFWTRDKLLWSLAKLQKGKGWFTFLIIITFFKSQDVVFMVVLRSPLPVTATCASPQTLAPMWLWGQAGQRANLAGNHVFFPSRGCFPLVPSGSSLGSLPPCRRQGSLLRDGSSRFSASPCEHHLSIFWKLSTQSFRLSHSFLRNHRRARSAPSLSNRATLGKHPTD